MGSLPLHPALVHIPLGIAFVVPALAAALTYALWRGRASRRAWALVVGMQATLLLGGLVAMRTGEGDGERVERVVSQAAIENHEEAAEVFIWGAGAALALAVLVLVVPPKARAYGALAATLATAVVLGLGVRVGHAGGELVYRHNAAAAYSQGGGATSLGGLVGSTVTGGEHAEFHEGRR